MLTIFLLIGTAVGEVRSQDNPTDQKANQKQGTAGKATLSAVAAIAKAPTAPKPSETNQNVVEVITLPLPKNAALARPDASAIVQLMGNPTPFTLAAAGPNLIIIYTTKDESKLSDNDRELRRTLHDQILFLAAEPQVLEINVPHTAVLGNL